LQLLFIDFKYSTAVPKIGVAAFLTSIIRSLEEPV
jgi:hypothetical protein